ncbi:venom serine protease-like [Zophobas morio]|uniref:venom serine protease-like n=1 Tax=Zophobas morio TaxID=2755281 RepID=UPI003083A255
MLSHADLEIDPVCDRKINLWKRVVIKKETEDPVNLVFPLHRSTKACRWIVENADGNRMRVSCDMVKIPASENCEQEKLSISTTGDKEFRDARNYCGNTTFIEYTKGNRLAVAQFAEGAIQGTYSCVVQSLSEQSNCSCGYESPKSNDDGKATITEYPSTAALMFIATEEAFCGATIISPRYAVTAASCTENWDSDDLALLVGSDDHNLDTVTNTTDVIPIWLIERHPLYSSYKFAYDIALLHTHREIHFNSVVTPVCLPFKNSFHSLEGKTLTALDWGFHNTSGHIALRRVQWSVISNETCNNALARKYMNGIFSHQFCTRGSTICRPNKGGPLLWKDPDSSKLQLVGIISYSFDCGISNSVVNTNIYELLPWIVSYSIGDDFCLKPTHHQEAFHNPLESYTNGGRHLETAVPCGTWRPVSRYQALLVQGGTSLRSGLVNPLAYYLAAVGIWATT